ncbi:hypothetical protein [Terrabacter sp. MAHUQ-38]|uniref:hypothetical protein n=1 Tax=unclassified Terrabacter TaxID=2630222 RepID=UPI00165DAD3A|nr:hypothetical protein [Terrabacter sp. MAHUQ-38]MBC9822748.1 hypothetical protein [Terrabacter sp. MAHUQ-38]
MARKSKALHAATTMLARTVHREGWDSPKIPELRQNLVAEAIANYVAQRMTEIDRLRPEQVQRIAALLGGGQP